MCSKKQVKDLDRITIDDEDINKVIEEIHNRNKDDRELDIGVVSRCVYDNESSSNEEKNSVEEDYEL